jgi:hypothetical protein
MKHLALAFCLIAAPAVAADKPQPWTALVVRATGTYDLHEGIASEYVCRQTLCFVQWNVDCDKHAEQVAEQKHKAELAEIERQKKELVYRADHPCIVHKDGTKTCPTSECSAAEYDKDGNSIGGSSWSGTGLNCIIFGYGSSAVDNSIRVAACFQDRPLH